MVSVRVSLKLNTNKKKILQETVDENRYTPELNEKEVIGLLENATPGSTKHKESKVQSTA